MIKKNILYDVDYFFLIITLKKKKKIQKIKNQKAKNK